MGAVEANGADVVLAVLEERDDLAGREVTAPGEPAGAAPCSRRLAEVQSIASLMRAAVKLQVTIPKDRRVQLPGDLPEGQAEIIVLYPEPAEEQAQPHAPSPPVQTERASYFERLTSRQPVPLSAGAARALDEADRDER
jgi:hypothetical protein